MSHIVDIESWDANMGIYKKSATSQEWKDQVRDAALFLYCALNDKKYSLL